MQVCVTVMQVCVTVMQVCVTVMQVCVTVMQVCVMDDLFCWLKLFSPLSYCLRKINASSCNGLLTLFEVQKSLAIPNV